jgi:hypothetical protein
MKIKKYISYINESLNIEEIESKFSEKYLELKKDVLDIINGVLEDSDIKDVSDNDLDNFIDDYLAKGKEADMIDTLIEDNDIFNFYLKHQSDIDELLNDKEYLDKTPKENDIYSLYDIIIDGTKQSLIYIIEIIKNDISST